MEKNEHRRKVISVFFALGIVIAGHSIDYQHATMGNLIPEWVLLLAYAVPTVGSFCASTVPMAPTIGAMLFVSLVIAAIVKHAALTSVWCFFAAALSVLILVAVTRMNSAPSLMFASIGSPEGAG